MWYRAPLLAALLMFAPHAGRAGEVAAPFPTPLEFEIDRIGWEIEAAGIPPPDPDYIDANLAAMELEPARLIDRALISLREKTCMEVVGVDTRYFITFFGT
jgi:hypothetical protein